MATPGTYRPAVPKTAARPQKYFTFNPLVDKRSHLKIGKGQHVGYETGKGYFAAAGAPRVQGTVARGGGTPQNRSTIETPAQIEARVTRMAQQVYDRQKGDLEAEAEQMRKEAEGRRLGMIDAYKAAQALTEGMGGKVQEAWTQAAGNMAGLAGATSGSIADALQSELATQEGALSRVGAAGTGFDARSQANVEAYRGGVIPGEEFNRLGAVGNEYILRAVDNLRKQGLQTGYADEKGERAKINADLMKQIAGLGDTRLEYETNLRKELLAARGDQIDAIATAKKELNDMKVAKAKLDYQYYNAKLNATTKKELAAVDAIYKQQKLAIDQQLADASVALKGAQQGLAEVKTAAGGFAPKAPKGPKSASPTQVSNNVVRATKAGNDRLETSLDNIADSIPGFDIPADMTEEEYAATPEYRKALALEKVKRTKAFGTIMGHVVKAITAHLKAVGYTSAQIKAAAYDIVSAKITPPKNWKRPTATAPVHPLPRG